MSWRRKNINSDEVSLYNISPCQQWRQCVRDADDERVAVDVVTELVVSGVVDQGAEADRQGEEGLSHRLVPNLFTMLKKTFWS